MDFIVYVTNECKEEAKKHNFSSTLESLCSDIEKKQSIAMFKPFPVPFLVKKKFGSFQGRLIAAKEIIKVNDNEYAVIKFLSALIRGSTDYTAFQDNAQKNGEKYLRRTNTEDIRGFVRERMESNPPEKKNPLSPEEQAFLYSSNSTYNLENDLLIYESKDWISTVNQKPYMNHMNRIYDTITELLSSIYSEGNHCAEIKGQPDLKIIYFLDPGKKHIFLADLLSTRDKNKNPDEIAGGWKEQLKNIEISRLARRSYPQYLLADENLWSDIEKDAQSNFSLSGEEIEALISISGNKAFPLFINGRAGSGKSTILQYLFAEYFSRYLSYRDSVQPPVYFTYNRELLRQAQEFVFGLLKTNSNFTESRDQFDDDDLNQKMNASFNELQRYLLSLVDDGSKFPLSNYVTYSKFIALWNEKFKTDKAAIKEYSPDISWHIIRTYIEGIDPDDYLEPDEYAQLEKDQKTVSKETYTKVYNTVWKWYYELKEERNLWDAQDLVRYIIESDLAKPRFSGIFCDEAQDFTRIEMEVIYRLSIFSDREMPFQHISKIPFAFAGDELQTLNPTGFRWDALTALFTEKFILSVYPDNTRVQTGLNFRELKNNYRSSQTIVNFCNALQLFRAYRFRISGLLPQEPWENTTSPTVARFEPNSAVFWQGIRQKTDAVFIIPCNEGEELSWIKADPILCRNIKIHNEIPDIPVLSANSSKGLEFNRVVVWGFGSQPGLSRLIDPPENEDPAQILPLEYHINKAYVAISRAKKRLYVVDTDEGIGNLWTVTKDGRLIRNYLSDINRSQEKWTVDNLATYSEGKEDDFLDDEKTNMEDIAKQFMETGLTSKNSFLLRQAAHIFTNNELVAKCEGIADIFGGDYISAGNKFREGGWFDFAMNAFWLGNKFDRDTVTIAGFKRIVETANEQYKQSFCYIIALTITNLSKDAVQNFVDHVAGLESNDLEKNFTSEDFFPADLSYKILHDAVNRIVDFVVKDDFFDKNILNVFISAYKKKIPGISSEKLAEMAFNLADYKTAVDFWEKSSSRNDTKYKSAVERIKGFPENIKILYESGEYGKISDQFLGFDGELTGGDLAYAVQALLIAGHTEDAFRYIVNFFDPVYFDATIKKCSDFISPKDRKLLILCHKIAQIANENWARIVNIISTAKNNDIKAIYIAAAIARTKSLPNQPSSVQKPVSDYLEKEIIRNFTAIPVSMLFEAGTAIEKAGRRIDILKFYEKAIECFHDDSEKSVLCAERWINAKELQVKFNKGSEKWIKERSQEAQNKRKEYGIGNKELDEFINFENWPDLYKFIIENELRNESAGKRITSELNPDRIVVSGPSVSEKQKIDFDFEGYKFSYYKKSRRLNITNNDDGKTLTISGGKYASDDYTIIDYSFEPFGACKKAETTPVIFRLDGAIRVAFDYSDILFTFL
jgi:hypothetical protein